MYFLHLDQGTKPLCGDKQQALFGVFECVEVLLVFNQRQ
jgi:hypothetical protein